MSAYWTRLPASALSLLSAAPPRWGKGNGQKSKMPSGHAIDHLTVGGRTSAVVPALQKASWGAVELVAAESWWRRTHSRWVPLLSRLPGGRYACAAG